jgi:curli biogenesis system outer membrane secretion channel CsgG
VLLARKVTHPNVCRVNDLYREGGAEYLLLGGRQAFGAEIQLNARLVRPETGEIVAAEEGNPPELAKKLAARVGK